MRAVVPIASAGLLLLLFYRRRLHRMLDLQEIRSDDQGDGHFGAHRTDHVHEGTDLIVDPGEQVLSPVNGTYYGSGNVYDDDNRYKVQHVEGEGLLIKSMYTIPAATLKAGDHLRRGDVLGYAQDISKKWGATMIPHIHVEVRTEEGKLLNPENLLRIDAV